MLPEEEQEEQEQQEEEKEQRKEEGNERNTGKGEGASFAINDDVDLLAEVLSRLDGKSLAAAACVCRVWSGLARRDSVWEAVCLRHVAGGSAAAGGATRSVVAALGGYRRLYRICIGPALDRLAGGSLSLSLSLSLFSIECYERLGVGGRQQQQQRPALSLLFLSKPVGVS